jgi:hypothetical protein
MLYQAARSYEKMATLCRNSNISVSIQLHRSRHYLGMKCDPARMDDRLATLCRNSTPEIMMPEFAIILL